MPHRAAACRLAVLLVFPTFMGALKVLRSVITFKRGAIADKEVRRPRPPTCQGLPRPEVGCPVLQRACLCRITLCRAS